MPRYDLFRIDVLGPVWVGTAETIQDAHTRASQQEDSSEYLVVDSETGERMAVKQGKRDQR
jgi:hypothetical protein